MSPFLFPAVDISHLVCCRVSQQAGLQQLFSFLSFHMWGPVATHPVFTCTLYLRLFLSSWTGLDFVSKCLCVLSSSSIAVCNHLIVSLLGVVWGLLCSSRRLSLFVTLFATWIPKLEHEWRGLYGGSAAAWNSYSAPLQHMVRGRQRCWLKLC